MPIVIYRQVDKSDIPAIAQIRAAEWGGEEYWKTRISRYLDGDHHPQHALMPRVMYVAFEGDCLVGFIAGHLTCRYACHGELEWINVIPASRGSGISSELLRRLGAWFIEQNASRICVNVDPANTAARRFYMRHAAQKLNENWLVWNDIGVVLGERHDVG